MSDFEKRVDPNATIQIDKIDALELVQLEEEANARAAESNPSQGGRRTAPPPLPPMPPVPEASPAMAGSSPPPSVKAPAARNAGKNLVYGAAFLLLLAGAIAGGLFFGARVRGAPEAPVATASAVVPSAAPAPSAAPTARTLNLPAVEISGP